MVESRLILDRRIRQDLGAIEALWEELGGVDLSPLAGDSKELVYVGYKLHVLQRSRKHLSQHQL